jgi:hypothetical protein
MKRMIPIGGMLAAAIALSAPADAAPERATGIQVNLFDCPDFDANTAFHVKHGHLLDPSEDEALGRWTFELMVDGALLPLSRIRVVEAIEPSDGVFLSRTYLYNFPEGLDSGEHELRGFWSGPDGSSFEQSCAIDF